ncbi:MAG: DUF4124 domain-containing protein [Burkholderiales bacterium]
MRTPQSTVISAALLGAALMASALPVAAQVYRYVDPSGKVHYTERPPAENAGRAIDKLSKQGVVVKRTPAAQTAEQRAATEDERKKTAEEDVAGRVEQRRIQAILSAYSSEREIESARASALGPVSEVIEQTEGAIATLDKRLADLKPEMDALGAKPLPGKLRNAVKTIESERGALAQLLEAKRTEEKAINARFEEDRRRYVEGSREIAARRANRTAVPPGPVSAATK